MMSHYPVSLEEWRSVDLPGLHLSDDDVRLAQQLSSATKRGLHFEALRDGTRVTATSLVGVVRLERLEVTVTPKLAGTGSELAAMVELAYGLDALKRLSSDRTILAQEVNLFDLIALLFVEECDRVIRGGLLQDYVEREEELGVIRGRLLIEQQFQRRFGVFDRLVCRFDEQEYDTLENRLLAAAAERCVQHATHPSIRFRAHVLSGLLQQLCDASMVDLATAEEHLHYHRLNEHYRDAHTLALLILRGLAVRDLLGAGPTSCFAFLLDMNPLFERFVLRLVQHAVDGSRYQIRYQHSDRSILWNTDTNRPYAAVVPDLLVTSPRPTTRPVAVDAKYKRYDISKVASGDIYQAFLYAYAFSSGAISTLPRAILVHPCAHASASCVRLHARDSRRLPAAEIFVLGISIPDAIGEIRSGERGP